MRRQRLARLLIGAVLALGFACSNNGKPGQKLDAAAPSKDGLPAIADGPGPESSTVRADVGADLPELGVAGNSDTAGPDGPADAARDTAPIWLDVAPDGAGWAEAGAELRMLDATVDGAEADAGPSPTAIDSAADAVAEIPCDQLVSAYSEFLASHRDCFSVDDCKVVGGAGTCNCAPTLGNGSGEAVSASAASDAYAYFGRAQICVQQGLRMWAICDAAPATNLRCESGKCKADQASCLSARG